MYDALRRGDEMRTIRSLVDAAYAQGFMSKCAEHGIAPAELLKCAQLDPDSPEGIRAGVMAARNQGNVMAGGTNTLVNTLSKPQRQERQPIDWGTYWKAIKRMPAALVGR